MKINTLKIKKAIFKRILKGYCVWSNLYMSFERKFLKTKEVPQYCSKYGTVQESWYNLTKNLEHYGSDPYWKGFDVISAPERFLVTKKDDCDTFACLAAVHFSQRFCYEGSLYVLDGLYCLNYGFKGHVVCVYKRAVPGLINNGAYIIIDNKDVYSCNYLLAFYGSDVEMYGILGYNFKKNKLYFKEMGE